MNSPDHKLKPDGNRMVLWFRRRMLKAEPFVFYTDLTPEDCLPRLYTRRPHFPAVTPKIEHETLDENTIEFQIMGDIGVVGRIVRQPQIDVTLVYGEMYNRVLYIPVLVMLTLMVSAIGGLIQHEVSDSMFLTFISTIASAFLMVFIYLYWLNDNPGEREAIRQHLQKIFPPMQETSPRFRESELLQYLQDAHDKLYGRSSR